MKYLVETNIVGVLAEALTAEIEVVLADEGSTLGADTATKGSRSMVSITIRHVIWVDYQC